MKNKILLYGIGTYKNRGVEAIVKSSIPQLEKEDITIATYDYENNKEKYGDKVKYINHYLSNEELDEKSKDKLTSLIEAKASHKELELIYQKDVVDAIKKSDICISAGGDNYCYGASDWLYAIDETVKKYNKKLVLWGASLYEKLEDIELINDMNLFDLLLIRESISYNELKKYVPEEKLLLSPDPAFSLKKSPIKLNPFYNKSKVIGINLSPITIPCIAEDDERYKEVIALIDYILDNTKYKVSLIPHVTTDGCNDLDTLNAIYKKYKENSRVLLEKATYDCNELKYIISNCELMIAARTHASIAAYSSLVPTLVIGYSVKSKGIATDLFGTHEKYVIACDDIKDNTLVNEFIWLDKNKAKIKKILIEKIPNMIEESSNLFEKIIKKLEINEEYKICDQKNCIGCGICVQKCPKKAIEIIKDGLGFTYTKINKEKCINCNLCKNSCPINKSTTTTFNRICYAAKNKDDSIRKNSTSGGIFSFFAEEMIKQNGVVYGVTLDDTRAKYIRITTKKEIELIRGSKYSQSNLIDIIETIKDDVKNNKKILFSGTPCQVGAVKTLLKEYNNIIYISVICHGVLSEKILDKYLQENCENEKIKYLNYRAKDNGWSKASIKIQTENKDIINTFADNPLMGMFNQNSILRESCYNCKFKGNNNVADLIIGDYWGIVNFHPKMFDDTGVSAVIVNSKKGQDFIEKTKFTKKTECIKSKVENICISNLAYIKNPVKPLRRYTIEKDIEKNNLELIYKYDKLIEEITNKNIELEKEKLRFNYLEEEHLKVIQSTRWKVSDKIFNYLTKIKKIVKRTNQD